MLGIGLNLNAQAESAVARAHLNGLIRQTQLAEEAGFALVSTGQHFLCEPLAMYQPIPLLSALAMATTRIRLLAGIVLAAFVHPVLLAEEVATIDNLSDGRVVLGVGLGYRSVEYKAFGLPDRRMRIARYLNTVDIARQLLAGETVDSITSDWELRAAHLTLRSVQVPRPEIWMAANSDRMVKSAAKHADRWLMNPHARIDTLKRQQDLFREARRVAKVPNVQLPILREMCIAESSRKAHQLAEDALVRKYQLYVRWGQGEAQPPDDNLNVPFAVLRSRFIVGDPDECIQQLLAIHNELNTDLIVVRLDWTPQSQRDAERAIELVGQHVLPELSKELSES